MRGRSGFVASPSVSRSLQGWRGINTLGWTEWKPSFGRAARDRRTTEGVTAIYGWILLRLRIAGAQAVLFALEGSACATLGTHVVATGRLTGG